MVQPESFYYPRSYFHNLALFCSNHMTRIFSPALMIFMYDDYNGWQEHLQSVIEQILLKARLDDNIIIGAVALLETFQQTCLLRPEYPNDIYIQYFLGAYMLAHRLFSKQSMRKGFWRDVVGGAYTETRLANIEANFMSMLGGPVHIKEAEFDDMRWRMYGSIRIHNMMRAGEIYDQDIAFNGGTSPPCRAEMVRSGLSEDYIRPDYYCGTYKVVLKERN